MRFVNILPTRKMDTFLGPYPSIPFSSLHPSLDIKVMAPLCIPPFTHFNNQPTYHWVFTTMGIDAADCWSLGRFQGFDKLCAWFCRRLRNVDMRIQTSLSRRRSSITVHPQSTVCASARSRSECYNIHAPKEVNKLEELVPRVLRSGGDGGGSE